MPTYDDLMVAPPAPSPNVPYYDSMMVNFNQLDEADDQLEKLFGETAKPEPKREYTNLEAAIGAGENLLTLLTGATSGAAGALAGTVAGIPKMFVDGDWGTQEGVDTVRDAMQTVSGLLTYEPKTEAGKEYAGEVADFYGEHLFPFEALAGMPGAQGPTQVIQAVRNQQARQSTLRGASAAQATDATRRQAQAQELPIPFEGESQLTRGQLDRDFEQLQFEREQAKIGATGQALRERESKQAETYGKNLQDAEERLSDGATYGSDWEQGQVVQARVGEQKATDWKEVSDAYNAARAQGELDVPVQQQALPAAFMDLKQKLGHLSPVIDQLINTATDFGFRAKGEFDPSVNVWADAVPVDSYVKLREVISQGVPNDRQGRLIAATLKAAIDKDMNSVESGPLFKEAQAKASRFYSIYDENPLVEKIADPAQPAEKIFQAIRTGGNDRVTELRDRLMQTEDGARQWRGIQGRFIKDLYDQSVNVNTRDSNGVPTVKPAALNRWITEMEKSGKMDVLFDKQTQEFLNTLRDVAQDLFTTPPGSVNYSNTSSALANYMTALLDLSVSSIAGLPLPITMGTKAIVNNRSRKKLDKKISNALNPSEGKL
jgi:hypothetical protein